MSAPFGTPVTDRSLRERELEAELAKLRADREAETKANDEAQAQALRDQSINSGPGNSVRIEMPPKLVPLFLGKAEYRVARGGRGSGKTRTFAKMTAVRAYQMAEAGRTGVILCGREFQNSLDDSSFTEVKEAIESEPWLLAYFDIGESYIRTKNGRIRYVFAGMRRNLASLKSKAKILLAWVDEAEQVSEKAWDIFIPTVREDDSEIWVTYNPELENSATNKRFYLTKSADIRCVTINWIDNPYFPKGLNKKRVADKLNRADEYPHIWGGDYKTVFKGAYFRDQIALAKKQGRVTALAPNPLMSYFAIFDIGGTGAKADAVAIWICQFIGMRFHFLKYYEAVGQELSVHIAWLKENGYARCEVILPHDGKRHDSVFDVTYESQLSLAGFSVTVVPNQGQGAAMDRVRAARNAFPGMWFDAQGCDVGLKTIAAYHEKWDDVRNIGLGPNHDYASHGADAFGLAAVAKISGYIQEGTVSVDTKRFIKKGRG